MSSATALRRIPTWVIVVIVPLAAGIAVLVTVLVSGDGGGGATARSAAADTVVIKNFSFSPNPITVRVGTPITVVNDDNTTHTFTANNGAFDTGDLNSGRRGSLTVDRAGTYAYHCEIHSFMKATLRVSQ